VVDGGAGTNWCDAPAGDRQLHCARDTAAPQVLGIALSRTVVDVTSAAATVTVSAHVVDDTGVRRVQAGSVATLTRGTVRDGWWSTTVRVPRYAAPGSAEIDVFVTDRVGRTGMRSFADAVAITDANPDRTPPVLQSVSMTPSSVDVRAAAKTVTATVRITDDLAGVGTAYLCPAHQYADYYGGGECSVLSLVAGTTRDGTWRASSTIPRGAVGGDWDFQVWLEDASGNHPTGYWFGPDQIAWNAAHDQVWGQPIPGGGGVVHVTGSSDSNAPVLRTVTLSSATVDTSHGAVEVTAEIAGTDVEGISAASLFISGQADDGGNVDILWDGDFELVSGTSRDGVWRARFTVPGGTPAGRYDLQVVLQDTTHFESWFTPGAPYGPVRALTAAQAPAGAAFTVQGD
jgi:hypothetical protein